MRRRTRLDPGPQEVKLHSQRPGRDVHFSYRELVVCIDRVREDSHTGAFPSPKKCKGGTRAERCTSGESSIDEQENHQTASSAPRAAGPPKSLLRVNSTHPDHVR